MPAHNFQVSGGYVPTDSERSTIGEFKFTWNLPVTDVAQAQKVDTRVTAATGGTTVTTSGYTTVELAIIQNTDATNYVVVTFRTADVAGTDSSQRLGPGEVCVLTDVTAASNITLTANTAACVCQYVILKT